jgi:hypothetical protein
MKSKYIKPCMKNVDVRIKGYMLMASETPTTRYGSTGLGHGNGISGDGDEGNAFDAL